MIDLLNEIPLAGLMLVVMLGFVVGRVAWRGISLGPAGGTLLVALGLGWLGLSFRQLYGENPKLTVGMFGFCLFIYSVGFEAGPRFFSTLRGGGGWRFMAIGTIVNVAALAVAALCGALFGLNDGVTAGLLAGALTSAPTYAAAAEICDDRVGLALAFALTYPVGLASVVLLIHVLTRLMREDLAGDATELESDAPKRPRSVELNRAFNVERDDVLGKTLAELDLTHRTGCYVTRLHRGAEVLAPTAATVLEKDDHVMVRGRFDELQVFAELIGPEVFDTELRDRMPAPRRVQVSSKAAFGKSLKDLGLTRRHRCLVTGIQRGDVLLEPWPELGLERGDVLEVVGPRDGMRAAAAELGRFERPTDETDIAVYAAGVLIGLLIGSIHLDGFGLDVSVGYAGGLLLSGIVLGRYQRLGPLHAHVPPAARQLVRDLGILLLVAETGVMAAERPLSSMHHLFVPTLVAAILVTVVPVVLAAFIARRLLRMRAVEAWGSIGGGMTSSAALVAVKRAADSNEPAISYAAAYAVASVLATLAGQVIIYLI